MIPRDRYLNKLISKKENGLIKVITGIRRCGKSYLLFEIYHQYLNAIGVSGSRSSCSMRTQWTPEKQGFAIWQAVQVNTHLPKTPGSRTKRNRAFYACWEVSQAL